jgi:hypothetical protein
VIVEGGVAKKHFKDGRILKIMAARQFFIVFKIINQTRNSRFMDDCIPL